MLYEITSIFSSLANTTASQFDSDFFVGQNLQLNFTMMAAIIGSTFGAIVSFNLLLTYEKNKEKRDINKVRDLIKSDFLRLYALTEFYRSIIEDFKQTLNEKIDELTSQKIDLDTFLLRLNLNFELNFWNTILTSGYLIKLPEIEIQNIQAIVDIINMTQKDMKSEEQIRKENIRQTLYTLGTHDKKKSIRDHVGELIESQLKLCESLKEVLEDDVDLEWFKPKEQIKTIKINPKYSHWQPKRTR